MLQFWTSLNPVNWSHQKTGIPLKKKASASNPILHSQLFHHGLAYVFASCISIIPPKKQTKKSSFVWQLYCEQTQHFRLGLNKRPEPEKKTVLPRPGPGPGPKVWLKYIIARTKSPKAIPTFAKAKAKTHHETTCLTVKGHVFFQSPWWSQHPQKPLGFWVLVKSASAKPLGFWVFFTTPSLEVHFTQKDSIANFGGNP